MSAAAAAAWVRFADASSAALRRPGDSAAGIIPTVVAAVDGVIAQGLSRLVPAHLLSAAVDAFQKRLARLGEVLAALLEQLAANGAMADGEGSDGEEVGVAGFTDVMEASLAGMLKVIVVRGVPCAARRRPGLRCSSVEVLSALLEGHSLACRRIPAMLWSSAASFCSISASMRCVPSHRCARRTAHRCTAWRRASAARPPSLS